MDLQNYQQKMQKIEEYCPSFSSYSSDRLAEIAARTVDEFKRESSVPVEFIAEEADDEEDFEFSLVPEHSEAFADECFYDGQIGSVFPVFNRKLLLDAEQDQGDEGKEEELCDRDVDSSIRIPLRDLFLQGKEDNDLEPQSSSSSSEVDELESLPPGTYCVWRPKRNENESFPTECKKSSSTGSSSKRWKLRDLLRRMNSDVNDSYVFLTPKKEENSKSKESGLVLKVTGKTKVKKDKEAAPSSMAAHEAFYLRNKAAKEGEKRKSYLPYRRDLVGFFANANAGGFVKEFPFH
ncbi:PREDICTED: uncharacterized protein LOC109178030 [Ipomoea nil]|uniref:uncharacterized protein LOC109178030 n=1 Tax=Ipomoea nil TaxID=35883 RepID=UPI0009010527|nr:PREDICTED: uncharacterized protein LOC109178030 [Ipomoea nil]